MINVIVPIVDKNKDFNKILNEISEISDLNILVGVNEDLFFDVKTKVGESENLTLIKFPKGTKRESIINSLQTHIVAGSILVMRKPLSLDEFNKFCYSNRDITTCKRENNKFLDFIFNVWQKILKLILGLKLYEGDPSVIYMNEEISAVVAASGNLSFSSRVNRWRGIEQETVQTKAEQVKAEYDKKDIVKYSIISALSFIIAVVATVCVAIFAQIGIFAGLLLVSLDLICLAISLIMLVLLIFNITVGKKNFAHAIELNEHFIIEEDDNYENENVDKTLMDEIEE